MEQWYVWLLIIIILTILEATTINLVTIWFVVSGLVSLVVSFFTNNFFSQFLIFVVLGIILLATTRPLLVKAIKVKKVPTNMDMIIGCNGVVTEAIKKNSTGEVKVKGKRWTAYADSNIALGKEVFVLEINGVKLKVEEIK